MPQPHENRAPQPIVPALILGALASIGCMQPYRQGVNPNFTAGMATRWPDIDQRFVDIDQVMAIRVMVGLSSVWDRHEFRFSIVNEDMPVAIAESQVPGVTIRAIEHRTGRSLSDREQRGEPPEILLHAVQLLVFPPVSMFQGYPTVTVSADGEPVELNVIGYTETLSASLNGGFMFMGAPNTEAFEQKGPASEPFGESTTSAWMLSFVVPADSNNVVKISWRPNPGIGALD